MPIDEDGLASGLTGTLDDMNNTDTGACGVGGWAQCSWPSNLLLQP